jgi:hypothetical protein
MSSFTPALLIQENINSAVDWMTADDDFLAEVYLSSPTGRQQLNFGNTQAHGGVTRFKAMTKAIATAKDHIKATPIKQRFLFKLAHAGRGNRALMNDLQETLAWADSHGLITAAMIFNQLLSKNIAEGFVWFGFPEAPKAVLFKNSGYESTSI